MRVRLLKLLDEIRSSYWFIPSLMTLGAMGLALATTAIDKSVGAGWLDNVPFVFENRPDGAREILSTIAGSMITVAGVVFSITVAAVVYASGQHGARLLTNFMRDKGNQITLGTFIATFLYCLMILRTVRSPEEAVDPSAVDEISQGFVPHFGMLVALILTLCSVAVLIYFIHHIPQTIHISNVTASIGRELRRRINTRFPERFGHGVPDSREPSEVVPDDWRKRASRVRAEAAGYLQAIDEQAIFDLAVDKDMVIRLHGFPGTFVHPGKTLVEVYPEESMEEDVSDAVRRAFVTGQKRTPVQDYMFLVDELVDIAVRALSPGINDPMTAVGCLDWLADCISTFATRGLPDINRFDAEGNLRVITRTVTFEEFVEAAIGQIRPYAAGDRIAALHMATTIGELAETITDAGRRTVLKAHADALLSDAEVLMKDLVALEQLRERHDRVISLLRSEPGEAVPAQFVAKLSAG